MITSGLPGALSLFRDGCELHDCGDVESAVQVLEQARALAENPKADAFNTGLVSLIDRRLAAVAHR